MTYLPPCGHDEFYLTGVLTAKDRFMLVCLRCGHHAEASRHVAPEEFDEAVSRHDRLVAAGNIKLKPDKYRNGFFSCPCGRAVHCGEAKVGVSP